MPFDSVEIECILISFWKPIFQKIKLLGETQIIILYIYHLLNFNLLGDSLHLLSLLTSNLFKALVVLFIHTIVASFVNKWTNFVSELLLLHLRD